MSYEARRMGESVSAGGEFKREAFGQTIRSLREQAGLSQAKLALAIGVDVKTISRIEKGDFSPSVETVVALSFALRRSTDELLGLSPLSLEDEDNGASSSDRLTEIERRVEVLSHLPEDLRDLARDVSDLAAQIRALQNAPQSEQRTSGFS